MLTKMMTSRCIHCRQGAKCDRRVLLPAFRWQHFIARGRNEPSQPTRRGGVCGHTFRWWEGWVGAVGFAECACVQFKVAANADDK